MTNEQRSPVSDSYVLLTLPTLLTTITTISSFAPRRQESEFLWLLGSPSLKQKQMLFQAFAKTTDAVIFIGTAVQSPGVTW